MKLRYQILLLAIAIIVLVSVLTSGGRLFWKENIVVPVIRPLSEPCGYDSPVKYRIDCGCDGTLFSDIGIGATSYHCLGECGPCTCYEQPSQEEVDCAELSHLDWAFPG
ncbi:hypothetical protein ACFL96_07575 [Thermoproteota archaeon]